MRFLKHTLVILITAHFFVSCGTKRKVTYDNVSYLSTKKIIDNYQKNTFSSSTMSAKLDAVFDDGKNKFSAKISLRIKKNKVIWLSVSKLGITIAKLKITPNNVQYYEKWNRVYFDGDFSLLSEKLKMPLTFKQVEDILLGQSVAFLNTKTYTSTVKKNGYELKMKKNETILQFLFLINAYNFKVKQQKVFHTTKQQTLFIDYADYQTVSGEFIPKTVTVKTMDLKKQTVIRLLYKKVEIGNTLRFPFKIPQGYKKIKL